MFLVIDTKRAQRNSAKCSGFYGPQLKGSHCPGLTAAAVLTHVPSFYWCFANEGAFFSASGEALPLILHDSSSQKTEGLTPDSQGKERPHTALFSSAPLIRNYTENAPQVHVIPAQPLRNRMKPFQVPTGLCCLRSDPSTGLCRPRNDRALTRLCRPQNEEPAFSRDGGKLFFVRAIPQGGQGKFHHIAVSSSQVNPAPSQNWLAGLATGSSG